MAAAVKKIKDEEKEIDETIKQEVLDELVKALEPVKVDEKYVIENRAELKGTHSAAKRLRGVFGTGTPGPVLDLAMFLQLESIKKSLELIVEKLDK